MPSDISGSRSIYALAILGLVVVVVSVLAVIGINRTPSSSRAQDAALSTTAKTTEELKALQDGLDAAATYVNTDQLDQAQIVLDGLATRFPDEPRVWHQYYELRLMQKRPADAYEMMKRLTAMGQDDDFGLRMNAGIVAAQLDRLDESVEHLRKACDLDPTDIQAPLYLANVLRKTHDLVGAREYLLRVIQINPSIHQAWGGLAQIAYLENHLDTALQNLEKARKLEPEFPTWIILQAKVLRRRNQPEDAITLLTSMAGNQRWQQEVVDEIAQCWALMGSPTRAAQEHVNYLDHDPRSWQSAAAAARFFLQANDHDSALAWITYAKRLAPEEDEVKNLAEQIER